MVKPLKENHQEVFSRESELVRAARWAYHKTHQLSYEHKGSHDISSTFREMVTSTNPWALRSMRCRRHGPGRKTSGPLTMQPRLPLRISLSLGLCHPLNHWKSWDWGDPFPQDPAIVGWVVLLSMVWKRRTELGYVVNHLWTSHYHLGLICSWCMEYFTTRADAMWQHSQLCKLALAGINDNNDDWEKEFDLNDNGGEYNDKFAFC